MIEFLVGATTLAILLYIFKNSLKDILRKSLVARLLACTTALLCTSIAVFFAIFGFGEILGGDTSGASHLVFTLPFCAITFLITTSFKKSKKSRRR